MKRGDIVIVALSGDYGKPRPAMVIQSDLFDGHHSVTLLPITSDRQDAPLFRLSIDPTSENGLQKPSQVMIDKAHTVVREKIGGTIGRLSDPEIVAVNRALALWLGLYQ